MSAIYDAPEDQQQALYGAMMAERIDAAEKSAEAGKAKKVAKIQSKPSGRVAVQKKKAAKGLPPKKKPAKTAAEKLQGKATKIATSSRGRALNKMTRGNAATMLGTTLGKSVSNPLVDALRRAMGGSGQATPASVPRVTVAQQQEFIEDQPGVKLAGTRRTGEQAERDVPIVEAPPTVE